ncbi:MAG: TolC family protein [Planctomycetes bacterium]|nr:TolC family protein [Planctomycetota bacterium]
MLAAAFLLSVGLSGCYTPAQQLVNADSESYAILEKRRAELDAKGGFTIQPPPDSLRQRMLAGEKPGALGLVRVLEVAAENSRDYQRRKEDLYLAALDLTLERFAFAAQRSGQLSALLSGTGDEAQAASAGGGFAVRRLLGTGAALIGDVGLSLARNLSSGDGWDVASDMGIRVTQPLLRGFGRRIVLEPLTQAERNVVYAARTFERFRRTFGVDVTQRYLRILQQALQLKNEEENLANLEQVSKRNEALSRAGRLSEVQLAQAQQDELRSQARVIDQRQRLQTSLDNFKLFLGLPITAPLELDLTEVERLDSGEGLQVNEQVATSFALDQRLDFLTVLDQVADAERKVPIAANRLLAGVEVTSGINASSEPGKPFDYDADGFTWDLGLNVNLPIDLISQRNAYRETLITLERAKRAEVELADSIRVALRDELRQATALLETLRIQANAVTLAERRIESTRLNQQAGRAETRDILEAQEALRQANNALISARVDYHLARLNLWRDMELLRVDESGVRPDPELLLADANSAPSSAEPTTDSAEPAPEESKQ